jgi:O-antigen/teichoic acid export membrane protein
MFSLTTIKGLLTYGDKLVIGTILSSSAAGIYAIGLSFTNIVMMFATPIYKILHPYLLELVTGKSFAVLKKLLFQISSIMFGISTLASTGLYIFSRPLINFIYGSEYITILSFIGFLFMMRILEATFIWLKAYILSVKKIRISIITNIINSVILIGGMLLYGKTYGIHGIAVIALIAYVTCLIYALLAIRRNFRKLQSSS